MGIENFSTFHSKLFSTTFQAPPIDLKRTDYNKLRTGQYDDILFPVQFKQESGKKMCDVLDTGSASFYLISDLMKKILEENNLTGWTTYRIKLYDKHNNELLGYCGFSVLGKCGPINYSKSPIIEKRLVPNGPICKFYKGLYIDLDTWDGSDFFIPENRRGIIVTKKAADILRKSKLSNVLLRNLSDFESSVD
jgi:hypothetical protein